MTNPSKFTITQMTTAAKHCTDTNDIMYNVNGIICVSSSISNISLFNLISASEANEASASKETSLVPSHPQNIRILQLNTITIIT